jgi:hypothetical protein
VDLLRLAFLKLLSLVSISMLILAEAIYLATKLFKVLQYSTGTRSSAMGCLCRWILRDLKRIFTGCMFANRFIAGKGQLPQWRSGASYLTDGKSRRILTPKTTQGLDSSSSPPALS